MTHYVIGIDLGGTKIEAVLHDGKRIRKGARVPTEADKSYTRVLQNVVKAIDEVRPHGAHAPRIHGIGIGTPGYVHNGVIRGCPNNPSLEGKALARDLHRLTGLRVVHENDAKCFALAEARLGAGKKKRNVIGLIVGTGVGAGIIAEGQILRGSLGSAGEVGHAPFLDKDYEYYTAGPALIRAYQQHGGTLQREPTQILLAGKDTPDWKAIAAAREAHLDALARLSATLVNAFNPDVIVYGGGVSKSLNYAALRARTKKYALPVPWKAVKLKPHAISDSAGAIGAAMLVTPER